MKNINVVTIIGKFVGTIATQLAQRSTAFKPLLVKAISNNEGISSRISKDQWNWLVLQPLSELEVGSFQATLLIVVDALDECEKESDVRQALQLLSDFRHLGRLHFRVFITSRPEIPIRRGFSLVSDQDHQDFVLHDISRSIVDHDISTFLEHTLTDIRRKISAKPSIIKQKLRPRKITKARFRGYVDRENVWMIHTIRHINKAIKICDEQGEDLDNEQHKLDKQTEKGKKRGKKGWVSEGRWLRSRGTL
jgi:hypothetical protein